MTDVLIAQGDSYGLVALAISLFMGSGAVIAFLFRALITSKDNEMKAAMSAYNAALTERDRLMSEKVSAEKSYKEVASEAYRTATDILNHYRKMEGKPPVLPPAPVVAEGHSPPDDKQKKTAELQTLRANMAQLRLVAGLPPRKEGDGLDTATARSTGPATPDQSVLKVLAGAVGDAVEKVATVSDVVDELVDREAAREIIEATDEASLSRSSLRSLTMCEGTFVSGTATSIVMTKDDGSQMTHPLAEGCTFTLDGKPSSLAKLKAGDCVEVTGDPGTAVAATR